MSDQTAQAKPTSARIVSPLLGRIIGGIVSERHENGDVTILFGGLEKRGRPLSHAEIMEIEARSPQKQKRAE